MPTAIGGVSALLDRMDEAASDGGEVRVGDVLDTLGRRSFGPVITFAGLVILAPVVGDVPGVPTTVASVVVLTVAQILLDRDHVWLPSFLLDRSVSRDHYQKASRWLRKPARWIDGWTRTRLTTLSRGRTGRYLAGSLALLIALAVPPMELVPFSANAAGLALTLLGIAVLTEDGLLTLGALGVVATSLGLGLWVLA